MGMIILGEAMESCLIRLDHPRHSLLVVQIIVTQDAVNLGVGEYNGFWGFDMLFLAALSASHDAFCLGFWECV